MLFSKSDVVTQIQAPYKKQVILADVNIPYKLSLDRQRNRLFFCINADEFSEQSFHSVLLELQSGSASTVPGIRNGFASAIDQTTGTVYLGGSDGIYKFNYETKNVDRPALIVGIDILDMYFQSYLYFVDTANQNLYVYKDNKANIVTELKSFQIQHFIVDANGSIMFVNSEGLYVLPKGTKSVILCNTVDINIRGIALDLKGLPHFIAQDGIYTLSEEREFVKILMLENGYGISFDRDNNIVYSDERTVNKLISDMPHNNLM